jgi:hypothetical protein
MTDIHSALNSNQLKDPSDEETLVRAVLGKWGVSTTTPAIGTTLERLVRAYDTSEGLPITEWITTARATLEVEQEECPVKKHCAKILELWDAECEIDDAMEHLRGLLSDPKRATEIQP